MLVNTLSLLVTCPVSLNCSVTHVQRGSLTQCCFNDGPHFQRSGDVETVLFQCITLITFGILYQTSQIYRAVAVMAANGGCKNTCEAVENWLRYQRKTLHRRWYNVGSVLCINNFWSSQWNFPKFTGHLRWYQPMVPAKLHGKRLRIDVWIGV